ncbi:MAG: glycosyltransferase family 2 protein [Trueperaceae bacterium]
MSDRPLVTIGIPTYNRADGYLRQALDSALGQTYPNCEIVVSDNCSSDDTSSLVRSKADERLRYFRHERNIGANNNFNFCLEQARGEYFLLLHDDDLIDPDFVESCIAAKRGTGEVGIIRTGTRVIDHENQVGARKVNGCDGLSSEQMFLEWFAKDTAFYLCSTLFNTARLREVGGFASPTGLFQDVVALAQLAVRYGRVDVEEIKASFRRHDANKGSSASAIAWADDSLYLLDQLCDLMPESEEELRSAGLTYLCRKCYRITRAIPESWDRWRTYLIIYRRFERSCSPVSFALEQLRKDVRTGLGQLVRRHTPPYSTSSTSLGGP